MGNKIILLKGFLNGVDKIIWVEYNLFRKDFVKDRIKKQIEARISKITIKFEKE